MDQPGQAPLRVQHDLVVLPRDDGAVAPVDIEMVAAHLAERRICAAVLDAGRIGVDGGVVVRLASHDWRVAVTDPDHELHPGPELRDVVVGMAHRLDVLVHVDDGLMIDGSGAAVDDEQVLAGSGPSSRSRVVTAWRDDDLLLTSMMAGELSAHGDAVLLDGWAITSWDDAGDLPDAVLPLPGRHHPVVLATRTADLRSVLLTPDPEADSLQLSWAPPLRRVMSAPAGSQADLLLGELESNVVVDADDDWPAGVDAALRPDLVAAQHGSGEDFLAEVVRLLGLPTLVARLTESFDPSPLPGGPATTRVGGRTALQAGWDHVRSPSPESDGERRLREMPRRTVVRNVVGSLVLAGLLVALVLLHDFRFLPEWLLWGVAGFAVFNAVSTVWVRLTPRAEVSASDGPARQRDDDQPLA